MAERSPNEQTAYRQGLELGRLLGEFRNAHPRHANMSDEQIMAATGEVEALPPLVSHFNHEDKITRMSAREEAYRLVDEKLAETSGARTLGDELEAAQRKAGMIW
jgi:hypothetical protein